VITWANRVFDRYNSYQLAMLPSIGDLPYTTASGWLWCLPAVDEADRQAGAELAEYLVEAEFLAEWSAESGFFPVRPSSLSGWSESPLKITISRMLQFALLRPTRQLTSVISPELKNSVAEVLTRQNTPAESAQKLIERLEVIDAQ
jgi:ABC-type glycerol-3-phosphate transport system substrate-binding protein